MKHVLLLFLVFSSTSFLCYGQNENLIVNKLAIQYRTLENEIRKNDALTADEKFLLTKETSILSNKLITTQSTPDSLYLRLLSEMYDYIKDINSNKTNTQNYHTDINNIIQDLSIKNNSMESSTATEKFTFSVDVNVTTRVYKNSDLEPVNGYKIYANPVFKQNAEPPLIIFLNTTNPSSSNKIPPGRYIMWAEHISGDSMKHYQNKSFTLVPYVADSTLNIFIDFFSE